MQDCNRRGCHNAMCDRYSDLFGYICDECFDEIVELAKQDTDYLYDNDIHRFMNIVKKSKIVDDSHAYIAYIMLDDTFRKEGER